ncbi:MAG: hypothetical protein IZT55_06330, partial [Anaerolineae bacterium]|nr:hypothetical protein [Anaerolineae bacterium]
MYRAESSDIDFMSSLCTASLKMHLVGRPHSKDMGLRNISTQRGECLCRGTANYRTIGWLASWVFDPSTYSVGRKTSLNVFEIMNGKSWLDFTPTVLRYLQSEGMAYAARAEDAKFDSFG